ncbi:MAG: alpha/beta hydrolase [Rhodospirillales bacterium]|nr:alpha/beta hydrolase [Rhodospirillales bacterium]
MGRRRGPLVQGRRRARLDASVAAPELPGIGVPGDLLPTFGAYAACAAWLDDLLAVLQVDRATVVGNSLGGSIAWRHATQNPERCRALVMVNGYPPPAYGGGSAVDAHPAAARRGRQAAAARQARRASDALVAGRQPVGHDPGGRTPAPGRASGRIRAVVLPDRGPPGPRSKKKA